MPQLAATGGSNGGMLMGNMYTTYPQHFGAIVCRVPLLDMKRFSHLLAGASWMEEYGNPDTDDWNYLRNYSPYHNVKSGLIRQFSSPHPHVTIVYTLVMLESFIKNFVITVLPPTITKTPKEDMLERLTLNKLHK